MFTSNEDYREGGSAPPSERAELSRIRQEGYNAGLSVGTVHAFVLGPDGHLRDTMHVATVRPDTLAATLEEHARALGTMAGGPVVTPCAPAPPAILTGALRLHLVARYLEKRGSELVPVQTVSGDWSALPGEDWITLGRDSQAALLPPAKSGRVAPGLSWRVDTAVAGCLWDHFYPPTENNDLSRNRIEEQSLQATIVSVDARSGRTTARLDGRLRMKHPFYKEDEKRVQAVAAGYLVFDPAARRVRSLRLVTDQATYGDDARQMPFGVAVRSLP